MRNFLYILFFAFTVVGRVQSLNAQSIVALDTVIISLSDCNSEGKVCLPLSLGKSLKMVITDNGAPTSVDIMNGCDFDTLSSYTYSTLFGAGNFGPYQLTSWPINGQVFTGNFQSIPDLINQMNTWDPTGDWQHDAQYQLITGGNPANMYDTMKVVVTSIGLPSFLGYSMGITPRGTELSFERGFHEVVLQDTINQEIDTFYVHVKCPDVFEVSMFEGDTTVFCPPYEDLLGEGVSFTFCTPPPTFGIVNLSLPGNGDCIQIIGNSIGYANACVIACDDTGNCDTTLLNIRINKVGNSTNHFVELSAGETSYYCLDTTTIGAPVASFAFCAQSNNGFAQIALSSLGYCVTFEGLLNSGYDSACVILCGTNGVCDTVNIVVKVHRIGPDIVRDTLYMNQSDQYCLDDFLFPSGIQTLTPLTMPDPFIMFFNINELTYCINYTGLHPGIDTLGLETRDAFGNIDSTFLILTVLRATSDTIIDSLFVGEGESYCLSVEQLGGSTYTVTNICEDQINNNIEFTINALSLCFEAEAVSLGSNTACLIICDNFGVCDTTIVFITALDTLLPNPPQALDDIVTTFEGTSIEIPVLLNDKDTLLGIITLVDNIWSASLNGEVQINNTTGIITYTPNDDFCDAIDTFMYSICTPSGCDTASVKVFVNCQEGQTDQLVFYQAISPNGDNINDAFKILNADKYPNNSLKIFNRWGNLIFEDSNYKSVWDGTWQGKPVADGTYFYIFNDGIGNNYSDFILVKR